MPRRYMDKWTRFSIHYWFALDGDSASYSGRFTTANITPANLSLGYVWAPEKNLCHMAKRNMIILFKNRSVTAQVVTMLPELPVHTYVYIWQYNDNHLNKAGSAIFWTPCTVVEQAVQSIADINYTSINQSLSQTFRQYSIRSAAQKDNFKACYFKVM